MKVHLEGKKKSAATDSAPTPPPKSKAVSTSSTAIQPVDDTKESKRHKKKKKKESEREDKEIMLKKMREDRMRREAEEQSRAEKLMKRHYGVDDEPTPKPIEEIPGRYECLTHSTRLYTEHNYSLLLIIPCIVGYMLDSRFPCKKLV